MKNSNDGNIQANLTKELKILIVEDEKNLAHLLKDAINSHCYSVVLAHNGKEGIAKFLSVKPDVVITDIMMPELDGLDMTIELRKIRPDIPIIVLSAFSDKEKLLKAIDVGINKYFIKPFDPDEVLEYISNLAVNLNKQRVLIIEKNFSFDNNTKNLYKDNLLVKLTKREKMFLSLLIESKNSVLSIDVIKSQLWPQEETSEERVRTFVKRFRVKTSKNFIKNVSGQGYSLSILKSE